MSQKPDITALVGHCVAYIVIILYHTRRQVGIYSKTFSKHRAFFFIHIGTGIMELARYHISKARLGNDDILPEVIDVLSCLIWSWTSLVLVKTLRRGDPLTTRPPYQAGAILRPAISVASYLLGLPSLHRISISALDSFVYARMAIFFFTYTPYLRGYSYSTIYSLSIPLSAALSIHESRVRGASLVFILATAYIAKLNEWVTHRSRILQRSETKSTMAMLEKHVLAGLLFLGFAELDRLREVSKNDALTKPLNDDYVPKLEHIS
ncbi:unnamed protein product [Penicillium nalgiovense]|uniref:Uncharacterized protein n=1 Tax=Penicillium nalgiovense TaxID=60175 RepID=A0A1V6Y549_PENNA|nr:hypothetical protein PENNAL_c0036G03104 [Penicillium nalgiovense]CAG7975723.1 unnamed protein product [Penicillium nalgiovense]CAG8027619.1 unnamed protein product [Penicillium nalgiovense]CAG8134949.1 unnamed protein product [Penicillium nalgiovense]CAG8188767.1 unnamed protein product [Penicillium nalgiovense]